MIIDDIEKFKEWLTTHLSPICEADPGALAKYVVALVKKDKPLNELRNSCSEQLDVFLQSKTKDFVETLFEVLESKSYLPEATSVATTPTQDENNGTATPVADEKPDGPEVGDAVTTSTEQPLVTSTSKGELLKRDEEIREAFPIGDKRRRSSRSMSPRNSRSKEDTDRRRFDYSRLGYNRSYQRRRSTSPRYRRRSRSPYRGRRSPYRPGRRSPPRGRGRGGRSWSRSPSRSPRRSPRQSRSRSRSPAGRLRSRSPGGRLRSRSRSPYRARSPYRRSLSPRYRSRSPRRRSPGLRGSRSLSGSPKRSRSTSPPRKVRRHSPDSRGPTPTQDHLADSSSSISVVSQQRKPRCRDYDEKGFCVRGDLCMFDHGNDPVIVENVGQFPPPPPPPPGAPPPPGHINLGLPPPPFFPPGRMPAPHIHIRPDFHQEPYNPEAPAIGRPAAPPYWPGRTDGPPPPRPPFMHGPPSSQSGRSEEQRLPVHARLGNRDLVNLTVSRTRDVLEVPDDNEDGPSSSSRTVIAPKDDLSDPVTDTQPPPPGILTVTTASQDPAPPRHRGAGFHHQQQRFHPYQKFGGPRKPFDFNRMGGYRKPDQTNCTLEVRKIPTELNNIAKINEHFAKFGTLTNIQVKYEGDPEAALVSYSSNQEALACYKCADPVFNNRFIKVFWHNKNKENTSQDQTPVSTTTLGAMSQDDSSGGPLLLKPIVIPHPSQLQLNNLTKKAAQQKHGAEESTAVEDDSETAVPKPAVPESVQAGPSYTSTMGTINKAPYNPAAVAAAALKAKLAAQQAKMSPTAVKAADFVSRMEKVKHMEAMKKEAALKKLEIQKHKFELLEKQMQQQKKLLAALEKKDMKDANKKALMETLKTLNTSIDKLKGELGTLGVTPKPVSAAPGGESGTSAGVKSPEQARKEILDVELELMTKSTSGEDTVDLQKKLDELTKVANAMGLLGGGRGRGGVPGRGRAVARGRAATTWVAGGLSATPTVPHVGRGRGRGLYGAGSVAARTLDRRPKVLEVTGFTIEEKEEINTHFTGLKGTEKVEINEGQTPSAIITFATRKDAEQGILHGSRFKTKVLNVQWYIPKPSFTRSPSTASVDTDDQEIDEEALLAGEDEEEDDSEERSWRP